MTESGFDPGLGDPSRAGVYFVTQDDLDSLGVAARDAGFVVRRVDLSGCTDKATLLLRIGSALDFPAGRGHNWDGLGEDLRDLSWLPAPGYCLLVGDAGDLRAGNRREFDILVDVFDEASIEWARHGTPFWAFLALPDDAFAEMDAIGARG